MLCQAKEKIASECAE